MKKSNFVMWVCVAMVAIAALSSCTAQDMPVDVKQAIKKKQESMYLIEWQSNQVKPYMHLKVLRQGVYVLDHDKITTNKFTVELHKGDIVMIGVNYEGTAPRPECYLAISRYNMLDYTTGEYNPNSLELMYELESKANGIGFSGFVDNEGKITD